MHVERATALKDSFHLNLPSVDCETSSVGALRSEILVGVLRATVWGAVGSRALLLADSRCQNVNGLEVDDRPSLPHFIRRGEAEVLMSTA
jgi:hypothetical protein